MVTGRKLREKYLTLKGYSSSFEYLKKCFITSIYQEGISSWGYSEQSCQEGNVVNLNIQGDLFYCALVIGVYLQGLFWD